MSWTAAIAVTPEVTDGGECDVTVWADHEDGPGDVVLPAVKIGVPAGDPDGTAEKAAGQVLLAAGWRVTGGWEHAGNGYYAAVTPT